MLNCPFCKTDLGMLEEFPRNCPNCGKDLAFSDDAHGSVQLISDSAEPAADECPATVESADSSQFPDGQSGTPMDSGDDPRLSNTLISDEWDDPTGSKTVESGEIGESGDGTDLVIDEVSPSDAEPTIQSDSADDPRLSKTVQSGEIPGAEDDSDKTMDSGSADDVALGKTGESDEFTLQDVSGAAPGADQTVMSDEFNQSAPQATLLSDELSQDAIKTMQTMWSGAFEGKTSPGMTIKGRSRGLDATRSSLVIRERSLSSPGEQIPTGIPPEYELIKVLGEGGMGVVYDARQKSVDRSVAVKMLKPKTAGDEKQRQKFLAEAVVTGDLDHPNIVPIYDVGTSERGLLFYSMKKVQGTPWMKVIQQKSIPENLEILMKVGDAVAFAHSRGVIHRDLKPENVMLGDFGEVLVMDWGLALPAPGYGKSDTISPSHSMGGTPAYMAPEMASGPLDKITFASDVYLLGAILYEILTGWAPHTGKNTMQCLFAAAKNDIRPAKSGGELMDIALKAMATNPKDRYQTIRDLQAGIREYTAHVESIALATHATEQLAKAEESDDYNAYARAIFGFDEALKQWAGNARAKTGLSAARVKYAASALRREDYDLGASQLDPANPDHQTLLAQLKAAQHEREARQQRLKTMKRVAVTLVAMVFIVVSGALIWIKGERDRADEERDKAVLAKKAADEAREKEADAKKYAETQRDNAREQEQIAQRERIKAKEEEAKATIARDEAIDSQKAAERAKTKEEYEAYIARIGLAAAKIDENAFGSARVLLAGCKPELRNWEWGRLSYLCGLSAHSVEAGAPLEAVAFSADGTWFVTAGWNHTVQMWETAAGKLLREIPSDGPNLFSVALSPDGRYVATGGDDPQAFVHVWDLREAQPRAVAGFAGHKEAVHSVAFSRDGTKLLTASHDRTARLWDVASGKEIRSFVGHSWWVWSAAFSRDEKFIATASHDGSAIIWNSETGERYAQFLGHRGPVFTAAFSPDGGRVVTGGYDTRILAWRPADVHKFDFAKVARGIELDPVRFQAFEGHGAPVRSVSFSADGKMIVSGSHDNTVKVWDADSGRSLNTFRGHDSWVRSCAFSPDGRTVVSAGHDHRATLWNVTDYQEVRVLHGKVLDGHNDAVLSAAFDRAGRNIVTASRDRSAKTWDFGTGAELKSFEEGHAFLASNAVFFPNGKRLLTAAVDNTVRFWDVTSGTEVSRLDRTGRSAALALSPDGKRILTGSDDRNARDQNAVRAAKLWDVETGKLITLLSGHKHEVMAVAFSPDGKWLFTGDAGGIGVLWDAQTLKVVHRLQSHTRKITAAAFLPDGSRLLTASLDKTVAQWDVASGKELVPLVLKHPDAVNSLALVPGRRQVLTSCAGRNHAIVHLWDLDQPGVVAVLPIDEETSGVAVSGDGRHALTVHPEKSAVRLWQLESAREILAPRGKDQVGAFLDLGRTRSLLWAAAFSPDGDSILTLGGRDARLWDVQKGLERMTFSPNGIVASAEFSPDASRIVTGSWDNSARVWDAKTARDVLKLVGHARHVNSAVYSPDGKWILTASDDATAILWDADSGAKIQTYEGHSDSVRSAVFSPDGKLVLTASADKTARLWNADTGGELGRFEGHEWAVLCAVFSPDGTKVLTGSEDNTARVWDTATRRQVLKLEGHTAAVASVTFLPDAKNPAGTRILTGSQDTTAKLWDALRGKEILTLKRHSQEVTCVNASTSGLYVITSSRDGTAVVWLTEDWTKQPAGVARRER
jgi:WD40 repeat protein/serine/threonine protein kinase